MKKERERLFGIRREKIYFWNQEQQKWDKQAETVWIKDKKGKEKPVLQRIKQENNNHDTR